MLTRDNSCNQRKTRKNHRLLFVSSVLALSIICTSLCSCDNNNIKPTTTDESKQVSKQDPITSDSLWYDSERIELKLFPDDRETIIMRSLFDYYNGEIRAVCNYFTPPTEEEMLSEGFDESSCYGTDLCVFDNNGVLKKRVSIQKFAADINEPYLSPRAYGFDNDKLLVLYQAGGSDLKAFLSVIDINTETQINRFVYDGKTANELCAVVPDKLMTVKDNVFMMCDDSGRIIVFDSQGNCRSDEFSSLFQPNSYFWDAYCDKSGTVRFSCSNAQEGEINIQLGSETITYKTKNYDLGGAMGASASDDGSYYAVSYSGISKYNQETAKFDMLIPVDSFNVNLHEFFLMSILSADENTMVLANTHGADPSTGLVAYRLTKASANPNEGKSRITIGLFKDHIIPPTLAMAIYEFNANSKDYYAGFKTYDYSRTYFEDADSEEKARQEKANELMRDIMDGKGPDVVINAFDIQQLNDDKYLCDMNDLVSSGNGINMAEYIEPVINLAKSEGKLYQMPLKFSTLGLTAPAQYAPANGVGYTFDEYSKVVSTANNGADDLAYQMDRSAYFSLLFTAMSKDIYVNGSWDFNTPDFAALANYCKEKVPQNCLANYDDPNFNMPEFKVSKLQTEGIQHYIGGVYSNGYDIYGFPSAKGNHGVVISVVSSAAISSQTANKDGAWEFIKMMMSYDVQCKEPVYASINLAALKKSGQDAVESYNKSVAEYKNMSQREKSKNRGAGEPVPTTEIDASAIDAYLNLIYKSADIYRVDGQVLLITKEEIQAYYFDQKSLDSVIELMNNRTKLYKQEQG